MRHKLQSREYAFLPLAGVTRLGDDGDDAVSRPEKWSSTAGSPHTMTTALGGPKGGALDACEPLRSV